MRRNIYIPTLLSAMLTLLLVGCIKEQIIDEPLNEGAILTITTRAPDHGNGLDVGSERERVVETLRLLIFAESLNKCVANQLYSDDALNSLKDENGTYTIRKRLKSDLGDIRICLIANEPATWTADFDSKDLNIRYEYLSHLAIDYADGDYQFIKNNGNMENMNLYPDDGTDNFLMYGGKIVNFTAGDVNAGQIGLDRTCAKVTLTLKYNDNIASDNGGTSFTLTKAAIIYQPLFSRLTNHTGSVNYGGDVYLPTAYKDLKPVTTPTPPARSSVPYTQLQPITFYIPEFLLTDNEFNAGIYTYIEILGKLTVGGMAQTVTYKIPLGEGVQKCYSNSEISLNDLEIQDFSIMRNHHYDVNATVSNLGEKDGIQLQVSIKDWVVGNNINVDDKAPYLNVSETILKRKFTPNGVDNTIHNDTIFFWSNQTDISIDSLQCVVTMSDDEKDTNTFAGTGPMFQATNGNEYRATLHKYSNTDAAYYPNNGYVDIYLKGAANDMTNPFKKIETTFYIKAGNLKRKIKVVYIKESLAN